MRRRIKVNGRLYEAAGDSVENAVRKVVKTYKGWSLIDLWNDICADHSMSCDVFEIDSGEFEDIFFDTDRENFYNHLKRGEFNPKDKYFSINDWNGDILSSNDYMDFIDVDYIVDAIVDDDNDFDREDIAQALGH